MSRLDTENNWIEATDPLSAPDSGPQTPLWTKLHRLLRGRYLLACVLIALFSLPLAALGWKFGSKTYASTGLIRVRPVLPRILYTDEEKGVLPMFDSFIQAQADLIKSRRVLDVAVQNPKWMAAYGKADDETLSNFSDSTIVVRRGEILALTVINAEPGTAQAGVQAMIDAYRRIILEQDVQEDEQRLSLLQQRQTSLNSEASAIRARIAAIATQYGSEDIEQIYKTKLDQVTQLEKTLQLLKLDAAGIARAATQPSVSKQSLAMAAQTDATLRDLITRKSTAEFELDSALKKLGDRNPQVDRIRSQIDLLDNQINNRYTEVQELGFNSLTKGISPGATKEQIDQTESMLAKAREEMIGLGRQGLAVADLKRDQDRVRAELERVRSRIEMLNVESATAGRISVVSDGDRPIQPLKDTHLRNVGLGLAGGAGLGLAIVFVLALLDGSLKDPTDVEDVNDSMPILGVLPELPEGLEHREVAAQAAHNVHHVRTMLEIWGRGIRPLTLTVTGPSAGSGKTSLTVALGVSFAAAGLRTLMVDLDFIGGGLSTRMEAMARRKLGGMLVAAGIITDLQRVEAIKEATTTGRRIGEVLIDLGFATRDQINAALSSQSKIGAGTQAALDGTPLEDCVQITAVNNLSVLALPAESEELAGKVASHQIRRVLEQAKGLYDVVLLDTGPSPGSLEAGAAAAVTAGVVLAVSRGEDRAAVRRCRMRIKEVGGRLAGVVFNRADLRDAIHNSSVSQRSITRSTPRLPTDSALDQLDPNTSGSRLGPIGQAVAGSFKVHGTIIERKPSEEPNSDK